MVKMEQRKTQPRKWAAMAICGERLQVGLGQLGCSNHAGLEANQGGLDEIGP
jgi:hypothetical protein